MPVEFNCEHCDMLLSADVGPGAEVTCPHCQSVTIVPEGLASLPSPQVPGEQPPAPPAPPPPSEQSADGDEMLEEEEELPAETKGVMRALALGMPWLISLFVHIAVLLILSLVVMYSIMEKVKGSEQAKAVVPPQKVEIYQDTMETTETTPSNRPTTDRDFAPKERPSQDQSASSDVIMPIAMTKEGATGGPGFGGPGNDGRGRGGGMYGTPAPGARNVIYVIDRSGSMHKTFGLVRKEMLNSISKLSEEQDFHVILFATGEPFEKEPTRLTAATDDNKASAATFLEGVEAEGTTNPIPALERAFALLGRARADRPGKLINLLTDGSFPDNQATLEAISDLNRRGDVHINTFLYGRRAAEADLVMKQIADDNQGVYKHVSPDEAY